MKSGTKCVRTTLGEMFALLRRIDADKDERGHYIFRGEVWGPMSESVSAKAPVIIPTATRVFKDGRALPLAHLLDDDESCVITEVTNG